MPRVFKRLYKYKGEVKQVSQWAATLRDHNNVKRTLPLFTDKSASEEAVRKIAKLTAHKTGGEPPTPELNQWLDVIPSEIRDKLAEWGLITKARAMGGRSVLDLVAAWQRFLVDSGKAKQYAYEAPARTKRIIQECRWDTFSNFNPGVMSQWTADRRRDGMAPSTINGHIRAIKAFCGWAKKNGIIATHPLKNVGLLNDRVDRRRPRRALTPDELRVLLSATYESTDIVHSLNGRERALLYWLAVETGFRYSELHSLARSSFDLDGDPALVWVKAEDEKARRGATQSIRAELADELKRYFADKPVALDAQAFPMPSTRGAEILRHDLKAARIPYRDEVTREYFDFHALRGQLGTLLARAGVPLTATQKIMRHSDPKLTANYYTFHSRKDRAEDLAKLP